MYTYNQNKNSYIKIADTLEIYKISTKIKLSYNDGKTDSACEKDFDHIKQLISVYSKILFFTKPELCNGMYSFKFGVEQQNLFLKGKDPVGVLKDRLHGIILFNDTISINDKSINMYITKEL
jgi:hypothetical protein